jgi:hypothetical protein
METISGRVPDDLYQWFAELHVEGAFTNSDKLRELLARMKRQHEGSLDYVSAQSWFADVIAPLKRGLTALERDEGIRSEVLSTLADHLTALASTLVSAHPHTKEEAAALEEQIVKRVFAMAEALLRQGVTPRAPAYDPKVVRKHCAQTIELAKLVD